MRKGTHPGPSGHPSEEGSFVIPSSEGCRASGGVGYPRPGSLSRLEGEERLASPLRDTEVEGTAYCAVSP